MKVANDADVIHKRAINYALSHLPLDKVRDAWILDDLERVRDMKERAFQRTLANSIEEEAAELDRFGQPCRAELEARIAEQREVPWKMRATFPIRDYTIDEAANSVGIETAEVLRAVILGRMKSTKTGRNQALIPESEIADYMLIRNVWPLVDKQMADDPEIARSLRRPKEWAHYKVPAPAWRWDAMPDEHWEAPKR